MNPIRLTALLLAYASLASCGGSEKSTTETTATDTGTTTTTTETAPAPTTTAAAPTPAAATDATAPAPTDVATLDGTLFANFQSDAAAGDKAVTVCRTCHSFTAGQNRIGPSLHGIVGRQAGTVPSYNYTAANKNSGITWTPEKLFQYLENPQRVIPGTKMAYPGQKDAQTRANMIAYLQTQA